MSLIGLSSDWVINYSKNLTSNEHLITFDSQTQPNQQCTTSSKILKISVKSPEECITHCSIQKLQNDLSIVTITRKIDKVQENFSEFWISICFVQLCEDQVIILHEIDEFQDILRSCSEINGILLPPKVHIFNDLSDEPQFLMRLIVLTLNQDIRVLNLEIYQKELKISSVEKIAGKFWWAQWIPDLNILAYAHTKFGQLPSYEENFSECLPKRQISVLQFHQNYPRETVLNLPLESKSDELGEKRLKLMRNPWILGDLNHKLLAHSTGSLFLFTLLYKINKNEEIEYNVNMLHWNQNLNIKVPLCHKNMQIPSENLRIDANIYDCSNGQFVVVVCWPIFVHLLDLGCQHEPSHHLLFDYESLTPSPSLVFRSLIPKMEGNLNLNNLNTISFMFEDLTVRHLVLNSTLLLTQDVLKKGPLNFKLSLMHFLLFHLNDINAAKKMIYESGKIVGNLYLTKIYQEFLIGYAHVQTRKQLSPNLEHFLKLIPYCPCPGQTYNQKNASMKLTDNVNMDVLSMLLSPNQRILPQNVKDIWTNLWNFLKYKTTRFTHKAIADKLLLSLQCYKPEALSRVSTPQTPGTPNLICSFGDLANLWGRRNQDLHLPFQEYESCTANKQEYIFSINLRELSVHLLKEKKEWSSHGQSIAGKYVNSLAESARLLAHLATLTAHLPPFKDKGFKLIELLEPEVKSRLFLLLEHYYLALGTLACPLPQGYTPFFVYLGYRTLAFEQFIWNVRSGTFDLQIDVLKAILADLDDSVEENISRKLYLISLLPKSRASRILNQWSHPKSVILRARQHASDLLSGVASTQATRKNILISQQKQKRGLEKSVGSTRDRLTPLNTFIQLLKAKANASDIDLALLTEATLLSNQIEDKSDQNYR